MITEQEKTTVDQEMNYPEHDPIEAVSEFPLSPQEHRFKTESDDNKPAFIFEYISNLDRLINRHPYVREHESFDENYRVTLQYITLKTLQYNDSLPDISAVELAQHAGVSDSTVYYWLTDQIKRTRLIQILNTHEMHRQQHEASLSTEAKERRIDPSTVYTILQPLREIQEYNDPDLLALAVANLYLSKESTSTILYAELFPYHQGGPVWFREIAKNINKHQMHVEKLLNSYFGFDKDPDETLRLAVIGDDTLFIWQRSTKQDEWINIFAQERFVFKMVNEKNALINEARKNVGLCGDIHFGNLIAKITDYPFNIPKGRHPITDLRRKRPILQGETLHFLLDATGKTLADVQPLLHHIGTHGSRYGKGRILSPKFPEIEPLRTRLYCAIICDGHIDKNRHLHYAEKDLERIDYVKTLFRQFGQVEYSERHHAHGTTLSYPVILGRFLERTGVPIGDKNLQRFGLPKSIINGSREIKCAYLEELIPEDGNFHSDDKGQAKFQWSRAIVIHPGSKKAAYNLDSEISPELKEFISIHGKETAIRIEGEEQSRYINLRISTIEKLAESDNPQLRIHASSLLEIVNSNPHQLLLDEVALCRSLDINIREGPRTVNLYKSGRVSVQWEAVTRGQKDAMNWMKIAPPADVRKYELAKRWIESKSGFS